MSVTKSPPTSRIICKNSNEIVKKEKEIPKQLIDTWIAIAFRVFDRMCDKVETPCCLSFPQTISNLAFLISTCEAENTAGIRREFNHVNGQNISNIQTRELIDSTLDFVRSWNASLYIASKPGYNIAVRRVICHPKYAKSYTFNTFKTLRRFEVELKIYEGTQETHHWLDKNLKFDLPSNQILTLWSNDDIVDVNNSAAVVKKSSRKLAMMQPKKSGTSSQLSETTASQHRQELRAEKRSPILVWASHAMIAIHPEVMDASAIYEMNGVECLRLSDATSRIKLHVACSEYDWNTLIIPTAQKSLQLVVFYNMAKNRPNYDQIQSIIAKNEARPFCLLRRRDAAATLPPGVATPTAVRNVYIPYWNSQDFRGINVAEHFLACLEMNSIFYAGGFGDLAAPDAEPSASSAPNRIHHIQHHTVMTVVNSPPHTVIKIEPSLAEHQQQQLQQRSARNSSSKSQSTKMSRSSSKKLSSASESTAPLRGIPEGNQDEIVTQPFLMVLWDSSKDLPVFMGKITENRRKNWDLMRQLEKEKRDWCSIC